MQTTSHLRLVGSTDNDTLPQPETHSPAQSANSLNDRIRQLLESATPATPEPHAIEQRLQVIEQQLVSVLAAIQHKGQGVA